tara:strand:+ start:305 stop:493 length:189 start_codon:yes stop_codon:yes gene_type:complete
MAHISVKLYYELNWNMMFHHNFSLTEIENMMPWEREIYIGLTMKYIEEENERVEQEQRKLNG